MEETFAPSTAHETEAAIHWAAAEGVTLEVMGAGTKRRLGRPVDAGRILDLSRLAGTLYYEPEELIFAAKPGTRLRDVEHLLDQRHQMLAFEPPDLGPLLGEGASLGTLGGVIACNLSGPRRIKTGAARDHLLGCAGVSGRGESFKTGGRVMKNVTGYDLCKLMAGSYGTLAALTEVICKVQPKPEVAVSVLLFGLDAKAATLAMSDGVSSQLEISAAAHLPADVARASQVSTVAGAGASVTALRLEGPGPSVARRASALQDLLRDRASKASSGQRPSQQALLPAEESQALWREVRDVAYFVGEAAISVWRVSVPPMAGAALGDAAVQQTGGRYFLDWAGGSIWLAIPETGDGGAAKLRSAVGRVGGHATLVRGSSSLRAQPPVFEPEPPALAALSQRIKNAFDPKGILNPGRMVEGMV
jgi:glycolate oxidase FAD binding subunit